MLKTQSVLVLDTEGSFVVDIEFPFVDTELPFVDTELPFVDTELPFVVHDEGNELAHGQRICSETTQ